MVSLYLTDRYWSEFRRETTTRGCMFLIREDCVVVEQILFRNSGLEMGRRTMNSRHKKSDFAWLSRMTYE